MSIGLNKVNGMFNYLLESDSHHYRVNENGEKEDVILFLQNNKKTETPEMEGLAWEIDDPDGKINLSGVEESYYARVALEEYLGIYNEKTQQIILDYIDSKDEGGIDGLLDVSTIESLKQSINTDAEVRAEVINYLNEHLIEAELKIDQYEQAAIAREKKQREIIDNDLIYSRQSLVPETGIISLSEENEYNDLRVFVKELHLLIDA